MHWYVLGSTVVPDGHRAAPLVAPRHDEDVEIDRLCHVAQPVAEAHLEGLRHARRRVLLRNKLSIDCRLATVVWWTLHNLTQAKDDGSCRSLATT